jgi:tetratricopeptide (TPR) repeat protein
MYKNIKIIDNLMLEAKKLMDEKNYHAAKVLYEKVLSIDPRNSLAQVKINDIEIELIDYCKKSDIVDKYNELLQKNDFTNAIKICKKGIKSFPSDLNEWNLKLGKSYRRSKDYHKAINFYSQIEPRSTFYKYSLIGIAAVYCDMKNYGKCMKTLESFTKRFTKDDYYYHIFYRCTYEMERR